MRTGPVLPFLLLTALSTAHGSVTPEKTEKTDVERILANGNRGLAGTLREGVLTVRLEVRTGRWFPEADDGPSLVVQAFGEEGGPLQIPGPLLRVPEGSMFHATIRNTIEGSTLTLHGFHTRPGSPGDTIQVAPGATREVRFQAGAPGTYFYWGTTTGRPLLGREDADSQLAGALIVDPAGAPVPPDERTFVLGIWFQPADSSGPEPQEEREIMVINGRSWPHTERLTFTVGDSVRWRWINPTAAPHPMHLHGFYYRVDSRGSWASDRVYGSDEQRLVATELMLPGSTMAVRWVPERPGNWVFHCHFAFHVSDALILPLVAEATHGHKPVPGGSTGGAAPHPMAGLVLGLHVLPAPGSTSSAPAASPRELRLLAQSAPNRYGAAPGYAFLLHEAGPMPAADSIPVPSSTLVLRRDEPVRITIVNRLSQPTAVHWHGIELESFPDGVPGWSGSPGRILPAIAPGDSFAAEFTPPRAGTFIYHSHSNELEQINSGLFGALIVVDEDHPFEPAIDRLVMAGGGGPDELQGTVNGHRDPPPIDLEVGQTYRFRLININVDWAVMFSLVSDGAFAEWRAVAKDGADLPPSQAIVRPAHLLTGPGETADFEFTPSAPGDLRLEVKTRVTGWYVPVVIRVRPANGTT
ncbi:hypothetical protein BH18GEM1_BH18GEM1_11600 [soil metagenome]